MTVRSVASEVLGVLCQRRDGRGALVAHFNDHTGRGLVADIQECVGVSVGTAGCLETFKVFSDSALATAQLCQEKPCDQNAACVTADLGVDPTAPTG